MGDSECRKDSKVLFTIYNSIMIVKIYLLPSQRYARKDVLMDMFLTQRLKMAAHFPAQYSLNDDSTSMLCCTPKSVLKEPLLMTKEWQKSLFSDKNN